MNSRTGKKQTAVLLVLTVAVIVAAALVLDRLNFKLDLTAARTYSLSGVSKNLYKELPERLRVTYYVSPELASRHPGPRAVEDFMNGLAGSSHGQISFSVADPSKQGGVLESLGLSPQRMQVVENNEQHVIMVYSGLVFEYLDRSQTVPFVISTDGLEYSVVKTVRGLVANSKPVLTVLVGDSDKYWSNDFTSLNSALSGSGWDVRPIGPADAIPAGTKVLMVIGNSDIDDYSAYQIDQYLARGGKALFAMRGVQVDAAQSLSAAPLKQDTLLRALEKYGVKVQRNLALDQSCLTVPFQDVDMNGGASVRYVRYPHWVAVSSDNCERRNAVSAGANGLDLFWPSPLVLSAPSGTKAEAIIKTSKHAWLQTKNFAVGPTESDAYDAEAASTSGQYTLAVTVTGALPMAYAGLPVPVKQGAAALSPLPESAKESTIMVIGSADFANELMTMTESTFNANFIAAAADWLASGNDLAALKLKTTRTLGLDKVADPSKRALRILFAYLINVILIPAALIIYGLLRSRKRKLAARVNMAGREDDDVELEEKGSDDEKTGIDPGAEQKESPAGTAAGTESGGQHNADKKSGREDAK